jgi:hypothetical protein
MRKTFLFLLAAVICGITVKAQAQENIKMQSVFLYNFTRLVNWPASYQNGDFVIGVIGSSPINAELQEMAVTKKAGSQNIVIRQFAKTEEIGKCHIIYVPSSQSRRINEITAHLKSQNINALVVSDQPGATRNGSVINFVLAENRQRFELSEANARNMGLTLGAEIQRLAILVN